MSEEEMTYIEMAESLLVTAAIETDKLHAFWTDLKRTGESILLVCIHLNREDLDEERLEEIGLENIGEIVFPLAYFLEDDKQKAEQNLGVLYGLGEIGLVEGKIKFGPSFEEDGYSASIAYFEDGDDKVPFMKVHTGLDELANDPEHSPYRHWNYEDDGGESQPIDIHSNPGSIH